MAGKCGLVGDGRTTNGSQIPHEPAGGGKKLLDVLRDSQKKVKKVVKKKPPAKKAVVEEDKTFHELPGLDSRY